MDLLTYKLVALVVVGATGLVAGLLPLRLGPAPGRERFFALSNALAGGVFLGVAWYS